MRWRKRPWLNEVMQQLQQQKMMVAQPEQYRGHWRERFGNNAPIHIEIGCGRGCFITQMALLYPSVNFIAMDVVPDLVCYAGEKMREQSLPNAVCMTRDSAQLLEVFAPHEVERIYLNFSDPWPKKRHAKRRLTHPRFLQIYGQILAQGGAVHFKTDNELLFEYSLTSFSEQGYCLANICLDLYRQEGGARPVMTEYEQKFVDQGRRIFRCEAQKI